MFMRGKGQTEVTGRGVMGQITQGGMGVKRCGGGGCGEDIERGEGGKGGGGGGGGYYKYGMSLILTSDLLEISKTKVILSFDILLYLFSLFHKTFFFF